MLGSCKMLQKQSEDSIRFCGIFSKFKAEFYSYRSSKVSSRPDCIFEIDQLWQSGFSRVYSNCCCSCSFELEIIKISQSSHKMYSNNMVNFEQSTTILNACTNEVWKLIECTTYFVRLTVFLPFCNTANKIKTRDGRQDSSYPFLRKYYRDIALSAIRAKFYNAPLFNDIWPQKSWTFVGKNQNGFQRNRSTTSRIPTCHWIMEGVQAQTIFCKILQGI